MKWINTLKSTGAAIVDNMGFFIVAVLVIVALYIVSVLLEKLIEKKNGISFSKQFSNTKRITFIAMFSAIAFVLMLFEIPLWFVPGFYKIDGSEIPIMIGAFAMGPTAGVAMEAVKIVLKVFIKGTSTAFVGDFANFVVGCMFVVPASFIYHLKKSKKSALIGMLTGTVVMCLAGCFINAFLLIPTYAKLFMPMEAIIGAGTKVNKLISNLTTFIVLGVLPFNIIKGIFISIVTTILYKYVRKLIH